MAPMTRSRAVDANTPNVLMAEYYGQRATAGLIITEGTSPSPNGLLLQIQRPANPQGCWSRVYGFNCPKHHLPTRPPPHSTVTLLARLRGLSTSVPRAQAV